MIVVATPTPAGTNTYSFTQTQISRRLHPQLPPTPLWAYDDGLEVARLAKSFGMRTVGLKRSAGGTAPFTDEIHTADKLAALIDQADALVITLPSTPQTSGLVDAEVIARMRPSCIVVNVGRGVVVDEQALVAALRERRIAGAVLDVFAEEPLPPSSPLWDLPNVLVSPHAAALSPHEDERIVELFRGNLRRYLAGEPLHNQVRAGEFYRACGHGAAHRGPVAPLLALRSLLTGAGRAAPARSGTAASSRCPRARRCGSARRTGRGW
jgi:D-isomer specific 2-hydroxyacid dehydrogenase, NAD binding domain